MEITFDSFCENRGVSIHEKVYKNYISFYSVNATDWM